jgi:hypothetical protein
LRRPFDWSTNADTTIAIYRELTQVGQRCASC